MHAVFARNKDSFSTIVVDAPFNSSAFRVESAASLFQKGDLFFISDTAGANIECLGTVLSADSEYVYTSCPAVSARSAGSPVWKAGCRFNWRTPESITSQQLFIPSVEPVRSVSGKNFFIKRSSGAVIHKIVTTTRSLNLFDDFILWLKNYTSCGLYSFTYITPERGVYEVHLSEPYPVFSSDNKGNYTLSFSVEILSGDKYV